MDSITLRFFRLSGMVLLTMLGVCMLGTLFHPAHAQEISTEDLFPPHSIEHDFPRVTLRLEPQPDSFRDRNYAYRKMYHDKTIAIMLYGFHSTAMAGRPDTAPLIPKDRQSLDAFFKNHVDRIKRDYIGDQSDRDIRIMTGQTAFTSTQINRGMQFEPAKMAGITIPVGNMTFGGGYTWGERNPALMMPTGDGIFAGMSYDTGKIGFQASFLTSGQEILGWEVGGNEYRYSSLMFGTSFRVDKRTSLAATLQFRNDNDPLTTGENQIIATIGTGWRW